MNKILKIFIVAVIILFCSQVFAQKKNNKKSNKAKTHQPAKSKNAKKTKVSGKSKKAKKSSDNGAGDSEDNVSQQKQVGGGNASMNKDTTKTNELIITSSFKPSLRTAAKINFNATTPELDTTKLSLTYNIPAQNLFFSYQPVAIKPLSLSADSSFEWLNSQYLKVGFGNYTTPFVETGMSFGHPIKTLFNITGNYVSSKGNIDFQEFTKANLKTSASVGTIANHELLMSLQYNLSSQYKYGFSPLSSGSKLAERQSFNNVGLDVSFNNKLPNSYGISYKPQLSASLFSDNNKASETSILLVAPFAKTISDNLNFSITPNADITSYKKDSLKLTNNIFSISPAAKYGNKIFTVNIGVKPTWNNSEFSLLPDIYGNYKLANEKVMLFAGWSGYFIKNTYKNLSQVNPFINQLSSYTNTKVNEQFVGIKGSVGKHFGFSAQVSFLKYTNAALYVNDADILKSQNFNVLFEPKLNAVKFTGEVSYTDKEKLSFVAGLNYTQFTSQDSLPKAYGLIPLQLTTTVKYKVLKDVFVKADLFVNSGNYYRVQTIQSEKTDGIFDLNIGAECKVIKKLNLFVDFNNLFNNQYQRWHQYQVLGFNVVAGVVYSFH